MMKPLDDFYEDRSKRDGHHSICRECVKRDRQERYRADPAKYQARNREWHAENRHKLKERARELRALVLAEYGGACACCGESTPQFLCIDHVYNDGAEERRRFTSSTSINLWLKRQGFPKDRYQLLCHNCNQAKGIYGACPHAYTED